MKILDNPVVLATHLNDLVAIADNYKTEIGFWPPSSLEDAISRGRLIAAVIEQNSKVIPVGFLVFGGVFPTGRIQAVAVSPDHVRGGVAQTLVNSIVAKLEAEGYIAISAKPAKDLQAAQDFYQKNEFEVVRTQQGGKARKREIVVRERLLGSPNLLSALGASAQPKLNPQSDRSSNLWVIDINVLFDLVKSGRAQYAMAAGIFAAALDGRARVAVTSEFANELDRNSTSEELDPLLELAKALPKLRISAREQLRPLTDEFHQSIFEIGKPSQANTPQALSDCLHMAECVAGNASAFVTSDGILLRNRRLIREKWGLEVVAVEDFHDALSSLVLQENFQPIRGDGFRICMSDSKTANGLATALGGANVNATYFADHVVRVPGKYTTALNDNNKAIGLAASVTPESLGQPQRMLVLVDHDHPRAELVADTLLNQAIDDVGISGLNLIELADVPGQIVVRKAALQAGFSADGQRPELTKAALGVPITSSSFPRVKDQLRLLFGECCSALLPECFNDFEKLQSSDPEGFIRLEKALSPTLIASNSRRVCVQPIAASYAAELLGTSDQASMLDQFEGAFRSQKIYVSSGRSKNFFRANQIIMFYESSRTGGRGAIVAAARVDNVVTQNKSETGSSDMKRTVLDSVERFSASKEVTLTGFSSVLRFPRPVPLNKLVEIRATGTQNLQTTTLIATEAAQQIFDFGWSNGS